MPGRLFVIGEPRDPLGLSAAIVRSPEEGKDDEGTPCVYPQEEEPIYQFDPGGMDSEAQDSEEDIEASVSPESYIEEFIPMSATEAELIQFARGLVVQEPKEFWPADWESRNRWYASSPLQPGGADVPLPAESAKRNFEDWMVTTRNRQPLLLIAPTQDRLPSLADARAALIAAKIRLPKSESHRPSLTPFVERTSQYWDDLPKEKVKELERILDEAFDLASRDYGVEEAIEAGQNFQVPTQDLTRDLANLVHSEGNLRTMTASLQFSRADQRLSLERISASLNRVGISGTTPLETLQPHTCVDALRLARLATEGIPIPRYEGFSPNLRPPNPKAIYRDVYSAVNCTLIQLWEQMLVFIVPTVALLAIGGVHWTPTGWTTKVGKALGRYLFDARSKSAGTPLNSYTPEYLASLRHEWGHLSLPTIFDLVRMILSFEDSQRSLHGDAFDPSTVILFKGDLSKAFTLLSFSPDSVELTASELYQPSWDPLSEEQRSLLESLLAQLPSTPTTLEGAPRSWSMLYHTGSFGLRLLPFVFGVVSRFLLFLLYVAIWGYINAYVDDFMGVTLYKHLSHDIAAICEVVSLLLGPHAVEWSKWFAGRQIEWIGWHIDLEHRRVSFGRRNFLKVLHGFFSFNETKHVQGRHVLKLASWASRYTTVLRSLSPFTKILYSQVGGLRNIDAYILLDEPTIITVWLWRAILLQLAVNPILFSRPLDSFSAEDPHFEIEYDSSLSGQGLIIYPLEVESLPPPAPLIVDRHCGQSLLPWSCGTNSAYQNTAELSPPTMGLAVLAQLGVRHARISLKGDSKTSLAWSKSGRFTGSLCTRTAIIMMLIAVEYDLTIVRATHIPGDENGVCDDLSRFRTTPALLGFSAQHTIDFVGNTTLAGLLKLCDPTSPSPFISEKAFLEFWSEARRLVVALAEGTSRSL